MPTARRTQACLPCHSRKVKCPGGTPCVNCQRHKKEAECRYPDKGRRKVTVRESYINDLEDEIKRLKTQSQTQTPTTSTYSPQQPEFAEALPAASNTASHILPAATQDTEHVFDHDPWFVDYKNHDGPVYIGEAACTGFTTRCRQVFSPVTGLDGKHIVRTHFISDEKFAEFSVTPCPWPTYNQATLMARVVQGTIGSYYNLCRWDVLFSDLKNLYSSPMVPGKLLTCKLYAIFALGEVYSARSSNSGGYPGLQYFLRANREVSGRPERPRTESIEIAVMLCLYSLILNRRDAAYFWIGSALRMSMTQGMHHSIPQHQTVDVAKMEHRTRMWWTVYVLDRMSSAMMSHPISIPDTDIDIQLPSDPRTIPALANNTDLIDHEFHIATIKLARILGDIASSLYTRAKAQRSSLQRVQTLLKALQTWHDTLPKHLQLPKSAPIHTVPRPVATMHLWFNQTVILTTRPVLLYVLRNHLTPPATSSIPVPASHQPQQPGTTSDPSLAFSTTCITCAKENIRVLTSLFIAGSFSTFAYFYSNYLFSAGVTLGVASQLPSPTNDQDACTEGFEFVLQTLKHLTDCGNLPAKEFHKNLLALKAQIVKWEELKAERQGSTSMILDPTDRPSSTVQPQPPFAGPPVPGPIADMMGAQDLPAQSLGSNNGDAGVFSEPSLQGWLAQGAFDLPDVMGGVDGEGDLDLAFLYTWPDELGDVAGGGMTGGIAGGM